MNLSHSESLPLTLSLLEAGRSALAIQLLKDMARKADAFGKDLEIVVMPHDELTGQFQILLMAVGMDEPIQVFEPLNREQVEVTLSDLETAYPSAEVIRVRC